MWRISVWHEVKWRAWIGVERKGMAVCGQHRRRRRDSRTHQALLDVAKVDDAPHGLEVVGAHVLVLEVCTRAHMRESRAGRRAGRQAAAAGA